MFEIQRTNRFFSMCGVHNSGQVRTIDNLFCVRKHMEDSHGEWSKFRKTQKENMFAFVSSPAMPEQQKNVLSGIKTWMHPFRNWEDKLGDHSSQYCMFPESDFMDPYFVQQSNHTAKLYDFFYLTINAKAGVKFKGLKEFVDILPTMCGKFKLKGVVIVYYPAVGTKKRLTNLDKNELDILARYRDSIDFIWGWQKQNRLAKIMASCSFGLFPNTKDCSPRTIPECLLRNKPIMVNRKIWGGWHYVDEENTGSFFDSSDIKSIEKAVEIVSRDGLSPKEYFESKFGFEKSTRRLANELLKCYDQVKDFSHVYFKPYREIMEQLIVTPSMS